MGGFKPRPMHITSIPRKLLTTSAKDHKKSLWTCQVPSVNHEIRKTADVAIFITTLFSLVYGTSAVFSIFLRKYVMNLQL